MFTIIFPISNMFTNLNNTYYVIIQKSFDFCKKFEISFRNGYVYKVFAVGLVIGPFLTNFKN